MVLRGWRPLRRGKSLKGFASVDAPSIGLQIDDVAVHAVGSRRWATLPSRPMVDAEGQPLRDAAGKPRYSSPFRWRTHGVAAAFGDKVIALVEAAHPGALAGDGPRARRADLAQQPIRPDSVRPDDDPWSEGRP